MKRGFVMKKFNKVLAVLLALITVIAALPLSVIADSWMDVETEPLPEGDGSKVTVTVDAKALAELLRTEGLSKDTISAILANADMDRNELFEALAPDEFFQIVPREELEETLAGEDNVTQLSNRQLFELMMQEIKNGNIQPLLMLFYNYGMKNIDKIVLNGFTVAEQDYTDLLKIDAIQMMYALESVIPTLEDLAALDSNVLTSLDLQMEYLPEGEYDTVTKHIVFEFALAGGIEQIKEAATTLQNLLSKFVNELTVSLDSVVIDMVVPNQFASGYLELLNSDKISDEVKQKIMKVADLSGNEMIAFINDELTLDDICEILSAIEPSQVFEKVKNSAFVEAILAKVGKTAPNVTLDEVWEALNTKNITIENVCEAIENATGRDVLAVLKAAAPKVDGFVDKAEEIAQIQSLLAKVEAKLGIDISDISVEEILNRDANVNLLDKISAVVAAKVGKDIRTVMANNSPDELWEKAIAKAAEREDIYKKVRNYVILGLEKLPDRVMNLSIADFYVANGEFAADKTVTLDAMGMIEKLVNKLVDRANNPKVDKAVELLMSRLTADEHSVDVSVKIDVENLNRVTFMDHTRTEVLFSAFLPAGTDLNIYKHNPELTGYDFNGWEDENGYAVPTMPDQDITVYATMDAIELTFTDANGNVLGSFYMPKGATFNLEKYATLLGDLNANVLLNHAPAITEEDAKVFGSWRVLWTYGEGNLIDLEKQIGLDAAFYEDTTLVVDWAKNYLLYFLDPNVNYTVTYANGLYTVTVHDDFATEYCLNVKDVLVKAETDGTVALDLVIEKENIVLASIKNATLKSLNTATAANNQVWLDYKATDVVADSFIGTFYAGADIPAYSFSFTVSDTEDGANMSVVTADFGGETVNIQLPYANTASTAEFMTRVYTAVNAKREYVTTTVVRDGVIEFAATHFSDFVISNEYLLTLEFVPAITGTLIGDYADENGDLYFPVGAEFSLRFELQSGYVSGTIVDKNANTYITGDRFTMPAASEHLKVNVVAVRNDVTLTFKDTQGNVVGTIKMPRGSSFNTSPYSSLLRLLNEELLQNSPDISADDAKVFGSWRVIWTTDRGVKIDLDKSLGLYSTFNQDTTLTMSWGKNYHLFFLNPNINYSVTYNEGLYTVTVQDSYVTNDYCLNIKDVLVKSATDDTVALKLVHEKEDFVLADIKNATLKSVNTATAQNNHAWFRYTKNAATSNAFAGTFYEGAELPCYSFSFIASAAADAKDSVTVAADFGGETIKIQIPFADAVNTAEYMTRVYTVTDGNREYVATTVVRDGLIEIDAKHFSDFVISNEYLLSLELLPEIQLTLLGNYADESGLLYFPEGAQFALDFEVETDYVIDKIIDNNGNEYVPGDLFTMPAGAVTLTVYSHSTDSKQFYIFYYYFDYATGTLKQAADAYAYYPDAFDMDLALNPKNVLPEALNAVLAGYDRNTYSWSELNQDQVGVADISLFMVRNPISYKVDFVNAADGSVISTLEGLTVENAESLYKLPAVPAGKIGSWTVLWIDAPNDLNDATQNKITVVLSGKFEAVKHEIVHGSYVTDETPSFAEVDETVTVKVEDRYGYIAEITVTTAAGEVIEVVDGAFKMPDSAVAISVTYKPASFSYEINNAPGVGNYMDSIQVVIKLQKGEVLASISEECTLVSTEKNGDETVLTYTFVLDGEKSISYKIERSKSLIARIFEGKIFNEGFYPNLDGTGVDFERWSTPLFDALSFAMFSVPTEECSCTWLWILLIVVLVLILLITLLYVLGLKGIKIILLTYVATVIVEAFFWLCMLVARPFSKKNEEDEASEDSEETEE